MARKAVLTCPNCGVKIEYVTLHRGKVLGWYNKRERKRGKAWEFANKLSGTVDAEDVVGFSESSRN